MLGLTPRLPEFHADRWRRKTFSEIRNSLAAVLMAKKVGWRFRCAVMRHRLLTITAKI
jgi:hypothetical protein